MPSVLAGTHTVQPQRAWESPTRELLDMMLGHLPRADLASCTLLSHYWRGSALPHLFRDVTIGPGDSNDYFDIEPDFDDEAKLPNEFTRFHDFLSSAASSTVRPLIKGLKFQSSSRECICALEIDLILSKLPAVHSLSFLGLNLTCNPKISVTPAGWSRPRALKKLEIEHVYMETPNWHRNGLSNARRKIFGATECCLVEFLNLFGVVRTSKVSDFCFCWRVDDPNTPGLYWVYPDVSAAVGSHILPAFQVKELRSRSSDDALHRDLLEILRASRGFGNLETLALENSELACGRFLKSVGQNVRHLQIKINPNFMDTSFDSSLDAYSISAWTHLESLSIIVSIFYPQNHLTETYNSHALATFAHLPSSIRHLEIIIEINSKEKIVLHMLPADPCWKRIDELLSSHQGSIRITIKGAANWGDSPLTPGCAQCIKQQMPLLVAKQLITFVTKDSR